MKRKRDPIRWPDGARIAITPCVAFETWPVDLGASGSLQQENRRSYPKTAVTKKNLGTITDREFGERVGVFRMLELFQKEGIQTTFFPRALRLRTIRMFSRRSSPRDTRSARRPGSMITAT